MPQFSALGHIVGTGIKAGRLLVRGSVRGGAWATRRVGTARARGAANEVGMIRLFDLHAVSCAGDALIAIGLAGTIFSVPLGEARSKVALYLLITMVPFALLAPVVGPLLDHFRHGRRYALATTFLGRAFLAYVMSENLLDWGLYPAAFGVLALSRAYGVARSAAVPRLLPDGVGLSQVGARASVYGTFAGILVAPIGLLAFKFGPQWPLRVATVIFMVGVVVALRLPPRADSDPPEAMPWAWRTVLGMRRGAERPLAGRLVVATLIGSSSLRLLYGFLLLFLTFAIMGDQLTTSVLGAELGRNVAVGLVGGALALGTFLSTAAGTGLRIRRPLALQSSGLVVTAGVAVLTTIFYNLVMVTLLALLTAVFSGIAKLAVDASIQERVPEQQRATAFAHSETALMLAWVTGGGLGLIPFGGRAGLAVAALLAVLAAARAAWAAARLRNDRLAGRPDAAPTHDGTSGQTPGPTSRGDRRPAGEQRADERPTRTGATPPDDSWDDAFDFGPEKARAGSATARPRAGRPAGAPGRPGAAPASGPHATASTSRDGNTERLDGDTRRPGGDTQRPNLGTQRPGGDIRRPDDGTRRPGGDTQRLDGDAGARRWWQRKPKGAATATAPGPRSSGSRGSGGRADQATAENLDGPGTTGGRGGGGRGPAGGPGTAGRWDATGDPGTAGRRGTAGEPRTAERQRTAGEPGTTGGRGGGGRGPGTGHGTTAGRGGGRGRDDINLGGGTFTGDDDTEPPLAPPGYHVYRPSSAGSETRSTDPADGEDS